MRSKLAAVKPSLSGLLLGIVLFYSFILRISYWGEPERYPDAFRDYLIAHRMVQDRMLAQTGPWSGPWGSYTSPIYYYILAGVLVVKDNILFLELINIVLQMGVIVMVYFLGTWLFSPTAGITAAILLSFHRLALANAFFVWAPSLMEPFLYASYFFLVLGYRKKLYVALMGSILSCLIAGAIYSPAITMIPAVIILAICILFHQKRTKKYVFLYICFALVIISLLYAPVWNYINMHQSSLPLIVQKQTYVVSISQYFLGIKKTIWTLFNLRGAYANGPFSILFSTPLESFLFFVLIACLIYALWKHKKTSKKIHLFILTLSIVSSIIATGFVHTFLHYRHFVHIIGLVSLTVAGSIDMVFPKTIYFTVARVGLIALIVWTYMITPSNFMLAFGGRSTSTNQVSQVSQQIKHDVLEIQKKEQKPDVHFFQLFLFPDTPLVNGHSDAQYWLELENQFHTTFTAVDDGSEYNNYKTINSNEYVFVICDNRLLPTNGNFEQCIATYLKQFPTFALLEESYSSKNYKVYITRQI